ncbi:glutamate--cysteine ligase [Auritidibacter ignavus]|uniref:glutamate--cysteine ligase n=1 Tax=Auritidibacter ignavus TaxID=678932 RepID=UPI00109D3CB2|nr:glutamate--cysteine ligase [Auritidibacter ignavus]
MHLPFAPSEPATLGIEWELGLVDRQTGVLQPLSDRIVDRVVAPSEQRPYSVSGEFMLNTIELITGVCRTVDQGLDQLAAAGREALKHAQAENLLLYSQGTHPFASPQQETVAPQQRYQRMLDRTQWWGQQMVIYGVHVHVGLPSSDAAMPAINQLINYYPHLLALSASSPYWESQDTGYVSQRTLIFQQLPTSGLPFQFEQWSGFESVVSDLIKIGMVDDVTECRWDVRPVPRLGTVEMRICDGVSTLKEIGALAALTQCLVAEVITPESDRDTPVEIMAPWFVQENKWRAARYGLDAIVIINAAGDEQLVTEHLMETINRLEPVAHRLGCHTQLGWVEDLIRSGGPAAQQRRIAQRGDSGRAPDVADLARVVLDAAGRTEHSLLNWG